MIRRLQALVVATVLLVAAFSTGQPFLFYLLYLGVLVVGGSYVLTRLGLSDLEAGYAVNQLHGRVGDTLRLTYTLRNAGRIPKPWLEVNNPTNLPGGLAGRALSLGSRGERSWVVKTPLARRGHFRIEPLQIRTGDPFGLFEASAAVGQGLTLVVYPRVERLPMWRLPAANIEGSHSAPERTLQTTPARHDRPARTPRVTASTGSTGSRRPATARSRSRSSTSSRPPTSGSSSTSTGGSRPARATSRPSRWRSGPRPRSPTAACSRTGPSGSRRTAIARPILPADRGGRQHLKIMQLLAAVDADGSEPLAEALVNGLPRLRRGMTAVVITSSRDRGWVRPLAALRTRGVACVVVLLDAPELRPLADGAGRRPSPDALSLSAPRTRRRGRCSHALSEYELTVHWVTRRPAAGRGPPGMTAPYGRGTGPDRSCGHAVRAADRGAA